MVESSAAQQLVLRGYSLHLVFAAISLIDVTIRQFRCVWFKWPYLRALATEDGDIFHPGMVKQIYDLPPIFKRDLEIAQPQIVICWMKTTFQWLRISKCRLISKTNSWKCKLRATQMMFDKMKVKHQHIETLDQFKIYQTTHQCHLHRCNPTQVHPFETYQASLKLSNIQRRHNVEQTTNVTERQGKPKFSRAEGAKRKQAASEKKRLNEEKKITAAAVVAEKNQRSKPNSKTGTNQT